jgi:2-isopropylmalate synthase
LGLPLSVLDYREHAIGHGADVQAACYIEMRIGEEASLYGVGVDRDIITAAIQAVLGGVNRQVA